MRIVVVDDEIQWINRIKEEVEKYTFEDPVEVEAYLSGEDFLKAWPKADIIIADIEMGTVGGIQMMREYRRVENEVPLIFLTSHSELVEFGYWVNAKRFIAKSQMAERLPEAFAAIERERKTSSEVISVELQKYGQVTIKLNRIIYVETAGRKTILHMDSGRAFECAKKISDMEGKLLESAFVRTHRSYIVNLKWIKNIEKDEVVLLNDERVFLSTKKSAEVKRKYARFLFDSADM